MAPLSELGAEDSYCPVPGQTRSRSFWNRSQRLPVRTVVLFPIRSGETPRLPREEAVVLDAEIAHGPSQENIGRRQDHMRTKTEVTNHHIGRPKKHSPPTASQAGEWIIVEVANRGKTAWFGRGRSRVELGVKRGLVVLPAA